MFALSVPIHCCLLPAGPPRYINSLNIGLPISLNDSGGIYSMALDFFDGLNVLDLGQGISGPFCAKMFADLEAEVVKVEPPGGDPARIMGPFPDDLPDPEKSGLFLALNTNKRGVTLNLETTSGRELLPRLATGSDLLIENYPPSYLPGLGLDFAAFQSRNPRLVLTSITPFGQSGPWAGYQANNLILSNLSGYSREHPGPVEDNRAVLGENGLGMTSEQLGQLRSKNVI